MARKYGKILLRAPNWIGDAVMCLPALASLKALYPGSEIYVLTKPRAIPVFENNPSVAGIIAYNDKGEHEGLLGRLRLSRELREKSFDGAVLFQNAFDAALISFLSKIPVRIGYKRDLRGLLLTKPINASKELKKRHQVFYYLNIVKELGGKVPSGPRPDIVISLEEARLADTFLEENGLKGIPLSGASPGASYGPAKRWSPQGFAEVLTVLNKEKKLFPLIFGGPEDKEACKAVSDKLGSACLDLSGKVTLRQFMALAKRLKVFITNDSGPMHIGAALGVPTVAIFGSTDPVLTGPLGADTVVMMKNVECSPCFERECKLKKNKYKCLTGVTSGEVYGAAEALVRKAI